MTVTRDLPLQLLGSPTGGKGRIVHLYDTEGDRRQTVLVVAGWRWTPTSTPKRGYGRIEL